MTPSYVAITSQEDTISVDSSEATTVADYISNNQSTTCLISAEDSSDMAIEFNNTPESVLINDTPTTISPIVGGNFPTGVPGRPRVW